MAHSEGQGTHCMVDRNGENNANDVRLLALSIDYDDYDDNERPTMSQYFSTTQHALPMCYLCLDKYGKHKCTKIFGESVLAFFSQEICLKSNYVKIF